MIVLNESKLHGLVHKHQEARDDATVELVDAGPGAFIGRTRQQQIDASGSDPEANG